jgi:hypothetical protein
MSTQIRMDEIPFSTDVLCDTVPPVEPPSAPAPYKRPAACRLIAWRHDGPLSDTAHATIEDARAAALALHWAVYWKFAIACGRDMIERQLIDAPAG